MQEKISLVKNPLTVIAIFASTAEVSGTAILPFLDSNNQSTYLWFLMLFPVVLILMFFITLNKNHRVLYAPSDFLNQDHFVDILKNNTINDSLSKIGDAITQQLASKGTTVTNELHSINFDHYKIESDKNFRNTQAEIVRSIKSQRIKDGQIAELLVLKGLEQEFKLPILREMKIEVGQSKFIFDGVIKKEPELIGITINYMPKKNAFSNAMWSKLIFSLSDLYDSFNESQKKSFSLIFAIVTDDNPQEMKSFVNKKLKDLSFPVDLRVIEYDTLKDSL